MELLGNSNLLCYFRRFFQNFFWLNFFLTLVSLITVIKRTAYIGKFSAHHALIRVKNAHARRLRRARKFFEIFLVIIILMLVKVSKMHWMMLLKFKVQNYLHSDQNDFMSYIRDHCNHIQKWSVIQGLHRDHETILNFNCSFIGRNGQHLLLQLLFTLKITFLAYLPLLVKKLHWSRLLPSITLWCQLWISIDHDY